MKHTRRTRSLIGILTLLLAALAVPVAAQGDAASALASAAAQTASASAYEFEFDLDLTMAGTDTGDVTVDLQGTGALVNNGAQPALDLVLDGSLEATGVPSTPAEINLRVVDGILYVESMDVRGWTGVRLDELAPLAEDLVVSSFRSGFNGNPNVTLDDVQVGSAADAQEALTAINTALASLDTSAFATLVQGADETVDGEAMSVYTTTFALEDMMESDSVMNLLVGLMQLGDASATQGLSNAELSMVGALLGNLFEDSTVTLNQYVDSANYLRRTVLAVDMVLDPSSMGVPGESVTLDLLLDLRLRNFNANLTVEAPENAMVISGLADMMGLSSPNVALNAQPLAQEMTPTFTPIPTLPSAQPTVSPTTAAPTVSTSAQPITANNPTTVTLTGVAPIDLTYNGQANETITVIARSLEEPGTVDTTVEVLSPGGSRLSFNDDHSGQRNGLQSFDSVIEGLQLPETAQYTIRVTTFSGAGAGDVEVTVESSLAAAPVAPQTDTEGAEGAAQSEVIVGSVPEGDAFTHTFPGTAGQVVTITVRAQGGNLDPKATLLGPDGNTVAQNDDHDDNDPTLGNYDSRIDSVTLPSNGQYVLEITGFAGTGGPFELTFEVGGSGSQQTTNNTPVGDEETITGEVEGEDPFIYTLDAEAGDVYTLTVRSLSSLDPQIYVYAEDDTFVAGNDDHGTSDTSIDQYDSRITNLIITESGPYSVEVYGYGGSTGRFELSIVKVATGAPTGDPEETVLTGSIAPGGTFTTEFAGAPGEWVTVTIRGLSGDMDPRVELRSPSGELLAENDDFGVSVLELAQIDSRVENIQLTEEGQYEIRVNGFQTTSGEFAVTIAVRR